MICCMRIYTTCEAGRQQQAFQAFINQNPEARGEAQERTPQVHREKQRARRPVSKAVTRWQHSLERVGCTCGLQKVPHLARLWAVRVQMQLLLVK